MEATRSRSPQFGPLPKLRKKEKKEVLREGYPLKGRKPKDEQKPTPPAGTVAHGVFNCQNLMKGSSEYP